MTPEGPEETAADPESVGRATTLIALTQGRTFGESAELLRFCASARGMSLHALAVAVLSGEPGDQPLLVRSARSAPAPARSAVLVPRGGRHRAR